MTIETIEQKQFDAIKLLDRPGEFVDRGLKSTERLDYVKNSSIQLVCLVERGSSLIEYSSRRSDLTTVTVEYATLMR